MEHSNLSFYGLGIAPKILEIIEQLKFQTPTPIQHKAIPLIAEGKDLMGIAQTGTGKTMAFAIPTIQKMASTRDKALVLVPTRELALQVAESFTKIGRPFGIKTAVLIGGEPVRDQIRVLAGNPRVWVATPGRLLDLMEQRKAPLHDVHTLILDEADRMFDMGFAPQIEQILKSVPKERQTLLFSATMPPEIFLIVKRHMRMPTSVEIAPPGTKAENVTHELFIVRQDMKRTLLDKILNQYRGSVLLFCRTKIGAHRIAGGLKQRNHRAAEIHSDRSLGQRREALEGFKSGKYRILIATDIASRGIDVKGIELVINYDLPDDPENYIHRIGRTGRAGHPGHAISFATADQKDEVNNIERMIKGTLPISTHPDIPPDAFSAAYHPPAKGGFRPRGGSWSARSFRGRRR